MTPGWILAPRTEAGTTSTATFGVYLDVLGRLQRESVPFLVGGAFALAHYTGIHRYTKDFDLFLRQADCRRALTVLGRAGYRTTLAFPHWLGKVSSDDAMIDLIFSSGNGVATVDDAWFAYAVAVDLLELHLQLCPPEEMIWSKAFVQERERYDGADVAHLLRAVGATLDWPRLLARFGPHWRILLSHLILFGFIYPTARDRIPGWVVDQLTQQLVQERSTAADTAPVCQGTLLSREQYLHDIRELGYVDARLRPRGPMTALQIAIWTAAICQEVR